MKLGPYLAQPGHSQTKLSAATGINPSTICRILSGKTACSLIVALKIDQATDGAVMAEDMCTPEEAALLGRIRNAGNTGAAASDPAP